MTPDAEDIARTARGLLGLVSCGKDVYHADVAAVAAALLRAVEALEWYAQRKHLDTFLDTLADPTFAFVDNDGLIRVESGARARECLASLGGKA